MSSLSTNPTDICSRSAGRSACAVVKEFLRVIMIPDPVAARNFVSPKLRIRFTGGRDMQDPAERSAFNAGRYAWVKKRQERTDAIAGASDQEAIVFSTGTLYGQWPDGPPFLKAPAMLTAMQSAKG